MVSTKDKWVEHLTTTFSMISRLRRLSPILRNVSRVNVLHPSFCSEASKIPSKPPVLPPPELDLDYLLDEANYETIKTNISRRKGIGDIDRVRELAKQTEADPTSVSLRQELLVEAAKIPNVTHPESRQLDDEPKVIETSEWHSSFELERVRPFEELAGVLVGMRTFNLSHLSGDKTYYLRYMLAELEQALVQFAVDWLVKNPRNDFQLVSVPDLVPVEVVSACGMTTHGTLTQVYRLEDGRTALSGTAEMALAGMWAGHTLKKCPKMMAAASRCYRAETSLHAVDKGIYRVHHFTKVEMFALTSPDESDRTLLHFLSIQKDLYNALGLAYRVLEMPPCELGAPASRKFDIEAFLPGRVPGGTYGEVSSCSNCTDYQSRRLRIRDEHGRFVHTVNGTAVAVPRIIMAICEQNQMPNGCVALPEKLRPYMRGVEVLQPEPKKKRVHFKYVQSPRYFAAKFAAAEADGKESVDSKSDPEFNTSRS